MAFGDHRPGALPPDLRAGPLLPVRPSPLPQVLRPHAAAVTGHASQRRRSLERPRSPYGPPIHDAIATNDLQQMKAVAEAARRALYGVDFTPVTADQYHEVKERWRPWSGRPPDWTGRAAGRMGDPTPDAGLPGAEFSAQRPPRRRGLVVQVHLVRTAISAGSLKTGTAQQWGQGLGHGDAAWVFRVSGHCSSLPCSLDSDRQYIKVHDVAVRVH
ncbi:DUF1843 domain-containing protein [Streptomyces sp. NPDC059875]|uniref:DUF1843 domain-containing protein n=1 Tax=unclassified Streptomyces TaxID=2593676 RepID=UPI0036659818